LKKSNNSWTRRQAADPYVKRREKDGLRSRAVFKLEELNRRDNFLRRGDNVIDLGSSPGGWSESVSKVVGREGKILSIDSRDMNQIDEVTFVKGDCGDQRVMEQAKKVFGLRSVDLVLSDLAPNITGVRLVDEAAWTSLLMTAQEYVTTFLKPGGSFVAKFFQFEDTEVIITDLKQRFSVVSRRKPASSRKESREFFIVAKDFRV